MFGGAGNERWEKRWTGSEEKYCMIELRLAVSAAVAAFADDVHWSADDFAVNVGNVEGDEPQRNEDDANQEDDEDGQLRRSGEGFGKGSVKKIFADKKIEAERTGRKGDKDAQIARYFERQKTQRNKTVKRQSKKLPKTVARLSGQTLAGVKVDVGATKAQPIDEGARHAVLFREAVELIEHNPINQPKIGGVRLDGNVRNAIDDFIEKQRANLFNQTFAFVRFAHTDNHFIALLPATQEFGNYFDGMLQVGIKRQAGGAATVMHAGRQRNLLAEIARKIEKIDALVALHQTFDFA